MPGVFFNPSSMDRKRIYLDSYRDTLDNLKDLIGSKERLQEMIDMFPKKWVANHFGVNEKTLHKLCLEWDIKSVSHWSLEKLEEARLKFSSFFN